MFRINSARMAANPALLEQIAKSYEWQGNRHDEDAERRDW
jgi:hypothetical protein